MNTDNLMIDFNVIPPILTREELKKVGRLRKFCKIFKVKESMVIENKGFVLGGRVALKITFDFQDRS